MSLLTRFKKDLVEIIDKDWGEPVILIGPDGHKQTQTADDETKSLKGILSRESVNIDPGTGFEAVVPEPVLILRLGSLTRVPKASEKWSVQAPPTPGSETLQSYTLSGPPEEGSTIGYINLPLRKVVQI